MRNHLAEQVLNNDMLILFIEYQKSLTDPTILDAVIELLTHTSKLVTIFRSHAPIMSIEDPRLGELSSVLDYFHTWSAFAEKERKKLRCKKEFFITTESYLDLQSCINGFLALCQEQVESTPIIPAMINSDVVKISFASRGQYTTGQIHTLMHYNIGISIHYWEWILTHHSRSPVLKKCR